MDSVKVCMHLVIRHGSKVVCGDRFPDAGSLRDHIAREHRR